MPYPGAVTAADFYADGTAAVTARSIVPPHRTRCLILPMRVPEWQAWKRGAYIQEAFVSLSPNQREFLLSGMTDEEWDAATADEDEPYNPTNPEEPAF